MLLGNTSAGDGRKIQMYDDVAVSRRLNVGADLTAPGNAHGACTNVLVNIPGVRLNADDTFGAVPTTCAAGQFMAGIFTQQYQENSNFRDRYATHIVCCQL